MTAFKNPILTLLAGVLTLVLVEATLRALGLFQLGRFPPVSSRPDLFVADSSVGYHLWSSSRTCLRYPTNSHRLVPLVSNSDGFPSSRELGEADPRPRVLLLGDSFVMGPGVREGSRLSEVVEGLEPRWRVDNMGMSGWGLDLMVRALETFAAKARPDAVVLAVYTDDFRRLNPRYVGNGYGHPKFELVNDALVTVPYPVLAWWKRLRLSEALYRATSPRDDNYFDLNEALVNRFDSVAKAHGAKPAILFLPGRDDTADDRLRRGTLAAWATRLRIPFRDLTLPIRGAGVEETYITGNQHWNENGHRIAGEILHSLLATEVLRNAGKDVEISRVPAPPWLDSKLDYCRDAGG